MRSLFTLIALGLLAAASSASAHAFLVSANPAVGSEVKAANTLRLEFSEAVEMAFSGVELANAAGQAVALKNIHTGGSNRKVMLADVPQLAPGAYHVKWHVTSVDTHKTEGDFMFRLKP